ncbi:asparagine synthase [Tissierellaceae bacterium HCP3S3_D8]
MKKKGLITKILGTVGASAALVNRFPEIKKMAPDMDKMLSNMGFKKNKNKAIRNMVTTGLLGFGLAHIVPMSRDFIRQR